jgi:hypothetical protein
VPAGRVGGSTGSTTAHSSSLTSGLVIPHAVHIPDRYF